MRFCIGAGGAAFVVTQYWTTTMFANNIVGTANATTAGWGNLGGGVTQMLIANPDLSRGVDDALSYNDNSYVSRLPQRERERERESLIEPTPR